MSDTALNKIIQYGTTAERTAFTPSPAAGSQILYIWYDTDLTQVFIWDSASWVAVTGSGTGGINQLTGDVTAGPGVGSQAATIANSAVTNAKMADMADQTIKGNDSGGAAAPQDLTADEVSVILDGATDPLARTSYVDEAIANAGSGGGDAVQGSFLVNGGQVAWTSGLSFDVAAAQYYIGGVLYSSAADSITLGAADPTNDRIDVIAVDDSGAVVVVAGTAAANPSEPVIDPGTQLKLAIVLIPAAATEPVVNDEVVYYDNAGSPTEWDWTSSAASIVVNSTNNPKSPSTTDIEGTAVTSGDYVQGEIGSGTYDPSSAQSLILYIRSKATWANKRGLTVTLRNADVLVGQAVNINRTGTFGFDSSNTADYQLISIPISLFAIPAADVINQVRITAFGSGHGFYIDDIKFQEGGSTGIINGITQDQADARYLKQASNLSDLSNVASATAVLNAVVGDSGAGGTKGMVPAPAAGDAAAGKFLKADGTWTTPPDTGITELTGDVTAGPGSGSQAATIANGAVSPAKMTTAAKTFAWQIMLYDGGSVLTTGIKVDFYAPYAGTIVGAILLADQSGDLVVDIWKDTYTNYPPTDADSITSATPPTLSTADKSKDTTLSSWTTSFSADDCFRLNIDSVATITRATLILLVTKS